MTDTFDKVLILGGLAVGGYFLWTMSSGLRKTGDAVGDVATGAAGIITSAEKGVQNAMDAVTSKQTWQTVANDLSPQSALPGYNLLNTVKNAVVSKVSSMIAPPLPQITPQQYVQSAKDWATLKAKSGNAFTNTNPTYQSIAPSDMSVWVPPMQIQNTRQLAKASATTKAILTNSTTARYTGGIGKSSVTFKA